MRKGIYKTVAGLHAVVVKLNSIGSNQWVWQGAIVENNILHLSAWDNTGRNLLHGENFNLVGV